MSNEGHVEARRVKGFRDFLPDEAALREWIKACIAAEAKSATFQFIDTPSLEFAEVLLGSSGEETDKEVYRFEDAGGRQVALRFDLTVGFARFVSENFSALNFPFKKFQVGEVWRGEKPQRGRFRQFCQADFDIIGADNMAADVEVVLTIQRSLRAILNQQKFTTTLSHRGILSAIIRTVHPGLTPKDEGRVLIALDKREKVDESRLMAMLNEAFAKDGPASALLGVLKKKDKDGNSDLASISQFLEGQEVVLEEIKRFSQTFKVLQSLLEKGHPNLRLDLSLARGLGYYTGIVFESTLDALSGFGSISGGGRYNQLVSRFGKHNLAGVGASIGVDRLVAGLQELNQFGLAKTDKVFIAVVGQEAYGYAYSLLKNLRDHHIVADIAISDGKLANQFKYADRGGFAYVIAVGQDEEKSKTFSLKNMRDGVEEKNLDSGKMVQIVSQKLGQKKSV